MHNSIKTIITIIVICLISTSCDSVGNQSDNNEVYQFKTVDFSNCLGVFSVSPTKKVFFSKGNLQYQASTQTWRFADNQWNYVGDDLYGNVYVGNEKCDNANFSDDYSGWIDLFDWKIIDGSIKPVLNDGLDWRVLTSDEWNYLCAERITESGIRFAHANVNGVNGIIILPDNWNAKNYTLHGANIMDYPPGHGFIYNNNIISLSDWNYPFENFGAVFLPAAGARSSGVHQVDEACEYWTSTKLTSYLVLSVRVRLFDFQTSASELPNSGLSVRLVSDVQ